MIAKDTKTIAIDFDGTIVEDKYPSVGEPILFAFDTLKRLQDDGHRLILWTYRFGKQLKEAVQLCKSEGIEFYAINSSYPGEEFKQEIMSRKINVDIFIDDRNFGGFPGWGKVYSTVSAKNSSKEFIRKPKKGFFRF